MMLLLPIIAIRALYLPVGSAGVHEWLPDGRAERERYERFLNQFGSDQFLLVSWEGCKPADPRLPAMVAALQAEDPSRPAYLKSVQSSPDVVRALTGKPLELDVKLAVARLRQILIGKENQCVIVAIATPLRA